VAFRLAELAELVGGRIEGDPERTVEAIRALEAAGPRDLSFVIQARFRARALASGAGALLIGNDLKAADALGRDLLIADDPGMALARLLALFHPAAVREQRPPGIHPTAVLGPGAVVDPTAHVGPYAVIGAGSRVGPRAAVLALAVVGRGCTLGEEAVLHPHAVLYDRTEVGARSIVHSGAVLGGDGFGYVTHGGVHHKTPQVGRVVLEADVEVGINTAIDRATLEETRIGEGTKIDNLVQVGHNVQVGAHCILCGQVGLSGSTRLGHHVVLGGQAATVNYVEIGDGAQAGARAALRSDVAAGAQVNGDPPADLRTWRRRMVLLGQLEEMNRRLRALEKKLAGKEEG
jgi:UDP-3-O-[3-hydroxymyristoyl] glucosamine N-acyltransferase